MALRDAREEARDGSCTYTVEEKARDGVWGMGGTVEESAAERMVLMTQGGWHLWVVVGCHR